MKKRNNFSITKDNETKRSKKDMEESVVTTQKIIKKTGEEIVEEEHKIVLAIDFEASGSVRRTSKTTDLKEPHGDVIGVGICASWINPETGEKEKLDGLFSPLLRRDTVYENRCWVEFWSKYPEKLKELQYNGDLSKDAAELSFLESYLKFRSKYEQFAEEQNKKYGPQKRFKTVLVSDNVSFDIGLLDQMLLEYMPHMRPSLYCVNDNTKYNGGNPCTHSIQFGLLSAVDKKWISRKKRSGESWSYTERIKYLYHIPECVVEHDHNPLNDAYTIADEYLDVLLIQQGKYKLDESRVEKIQK